MNEVSIAIDVTPILLMMAIRVVSLAIGITAFLHFTIMAGGLTHKVPWVLAGLLSLIVGSSVGIITSAISGNMDHLVMSYASFSGCMILWALWIWAHGFYMKKFIAELVGE